VTSADREVTADTAAYPLGWSAAGPAGTGSCPQPARRIGEGKTASPVGLVRWHVPCYLTTDNTDLTDEDSIAILPSVSSVQSVVLLPSRVQ